MGLQRDPHKAASSNGHVVATKKDARASSAAAAAALRYMECRKNHAASIGGYAVDGCREFMPSGQDGTSDALRCAACSCHRSFHRRHLLPQPPDPPPAPLPSACSSSSNSSSRT